MYAPGTKSEKASKRDKKQETVEAVAEDVVEEIETITNTEEEN
jgi:hypothetical protein